VSSRTLEPHETISLSRVIELLEERKKRLLVEIEEFQFPCPDCKKHVGKIKWDPSVGGECPHCCAHIETVDFDVLIGELSVKHNRVRELSALISDKRDAFHDLELRKGLYPWERFLAGGCKRDLFVKDLYKMLSGTFHNIAHYDLDGFWRAQFGSLEETLKTLSRMAIFVKEERPHPSAYAKLENQIVAAFLDLDIVQKLQAKLDSETRTRELAELERLKLKYPNLSNS
jgi:hypothetical protein